MCHLSPLNITNSCILNCLSSPISQITHTAASETALCGSTSITRSQALEVNPSLLLDDTLQTLPLPTLLNPRPLLPPFSFFDRYYCHYDIPRKWFSSALLHPSLFTLLLARLTICQFYDLIRLFLLATLSFPASYNSNSPSNPTFLLSRTCIVRFNSFLTAIYYNRNCPIY